MSQPKTPTGLTRPEAGAALLAAPRRKKLLEHIWQRTSVSRAQFETLYGKPFERFAELSQHFPASESHHHAHAGGMLDHGLEIVAFALKLRQAHLLPVGAPSETQAAQAEAWTAAVAYGALLHDIGKLAVDLHVEFADGACWHPWHGQPAHPYRFRYRRDREYRLHGAAAGLLYTRILDQTILDWLCGFQELWSALIYVLAGQYEHAGILGEIVQQADQASVAQDMGGDPAKARTAPKHALQRKLVDGLRFLLNEELKLNQPEASDAWLTQDALWLVSKTVCDKLRAHLLSQGISGVPERNTAVFNVLQEHGIAQPSADGRAIWRATVSSDSGWTNSFTFLRVSPALIWEMRDRPAAFTGTVRPEQAAPVAADASSTANQPTDITPQTGCVKTQISPEVKPGDAIDSLLSMFAAEGSGVELNEENTPAHTNPVVKHEQPSLLASQEPREPQDSGTTGDDGPGTQFMVWLRNGVLKRHLKINDAKALIHTAAGTVFLVTPGIFQRYAMERPQIAEQARTAKLPDWEWSQKNFERLRLHKKQPNGLNIWTCEVTGPRKTRQLHGYLLKDGSTVLPEIPFDNPYLKLREGSHNRSEMN